MVKYYDELTYRLTWMPGRGNEVLSASFTGQILQGPALIGKAELTLKAVITAQEIVDDNFIKAFHRLYPSTDDSEMIKTVEGSYAK
jgi:hypothetical protein